LVVGALLLVALVLARSVENGMIFFPSRYPQGAWEPELLGAEEFSFRTADGVTLYGWWFAADAPAGADGDEVPSPVLLWSHGNGGNLTGRAQHAEILARRGVSVFLYDYRGYSKSEGSPHEAGIYLDAEAAYSFLTEVRGVPAQRIVLLGRSLGSAPTARLAARVPHAGTVLVSPLPSAKRMARRMFGGLPVDLLTRSRFPVVDWVAVRETPLLIIHGDRDAVIPLQYGREVFERAAEPKQFLQLAGAGHNDILAVSGRDYLDPLVSFARAAVVAAQCGAEPC
jgi:fermentation-respiration switch protein FrsA (DUF1100 family)